VKIVITLLLSAIALAGCSALGPLQADSGGPNAVTDHSTSSAAQTAPDAFPAPTPTPTQSFGPQVIIPVTGGPPVMGIPVGGNLFLPVTGGPPVVGIPTGP
jgi:hypothetical protein